MTHPNVDIVRDVYAALARGDTEALQNRFFAPDITWHYAGRSQLGGRYQGIDKVSGWLHRVDELCGGSLTTELHDVVGNDTHVIALVIVSATRDGRQLHNQSVQVFHVSDGKVAEVWTLPGDQYSADDFWS
jgi:ketosteroid isomerase-like protein